MLVIEPDGRGEVRELDQDLPVLQGLVGGYLEAQYARWDEDGVPTVTFFFNEEGIREQLPVNPAATALWHYLNPEMVGVGPLLGTVVVTGGPDENSDIRSVPQEVITTWEM